MIKLGPHEMHKGMSGRLPKVWRECVPEAGGALDPGWKDRWIWGANVVWMSSFAGELAEIIECQTALMFTEEPLSAAPFGPVYKCGGRGLNTSLSVTCFVFFLFYHHWVSLSSSAAFPPLLWRSNASCSYLLPDTCRADGDGLITTCPNSDPIVVVATVCHATSLGGCCDDSVVWWTKQTRRQTPGTWSLDWCVCAEFLGP